MSTLSKLSLIILTGTMFLQLASAQSNEAIVGEMRIQALSENLVRIEQRGPNGFEDRNTFTVIDRNWQGGTISAQQQEDLTVLTTSKYSIEVPQNCRSLNGIIIRFDPAVWFDSAHHDGGKPIEYRFNGLPKQDYLPEPSNDYQIWIFADAPRLVPPSWGAIPPPENFSDDPTSGWDTTNNAEDVYVFLLEPGKYETFKHDFLKLTGHTPMPPLYAFGLWNSRYHPYSEEEALQTIDKYREKKIPLDMFVVDTDWRRGASHGYATNDTLFPDMKRFITRAHEKQVRLMYNDHPEAQTKSALDPSELRYRWKGLTSLFDLGIDVWWYDRNWMTGLHEPMAGISKEVWGMRMYHDITQKYYPDRRPLIMSNVDGIDNGHWNKPSHPASHRFPIWWTGDQKSRWEYLEMGISNGVNSGIQRMMPYVNEDLGGHTSGNPDPEQYIRWVQFGVFSPITRLHCTRGLTRYPWDYGEEAERITSDYFRLRYRLMPTLYAAVRRAYEDGTPIMRRCDLEWANEPEAKRDRQFMFGEDLLIVPIALSKTKDIPVPVQLLQTPDGRPGFRGEYFNNMNLKGSPVFVRTDSGLNFIWGEGAPDPRIAADSFSVRWTGKITPLEKGSKFKVVSDDGVRVWIDDSLVVDAWLDQPATDYPIKKDMEPGHSYSIRIEFYENGGGAQFQFMQITEVPQVFTAWIPPGNWQDIWTGEMHQGPKLVDLSPVLWKCPVYVRNGGIIFSLPQMQYTGEHPWDNVIVDAFVPAEISMKTTRVLYEDDGVSPEYQKEAFCKTPVTLERNGDIIQLVIDKRQGNYSGAITSRDWTIRLNLPQNSAPTDIEVNGKKLVPGSSDAIALITQPELREEAMPFAGVGSKPRTMAGQILEVKVHQKDVGEVVRISCRIK
jgi:alpha-glucosidase (family GH31 glycosyl hydrolase)